MTDTTEDSGEGPARGEAEGAEEQAGAYRVSLPLFEGPLDLLLHLIQKHELDILEIPIAFIAEKYVTYLKEMEKLSIDVAADYLVMAATLTYIKSRSLLPPDPSQIDEETGLPEEEEDPRAELIARLLEYQKYKKAAEDLGTRSVLGRDVFPRGIPNEETTAPAPLAPLSLFKLVDAFEGVLKRAKVVEEHNIDFERISITERIGEISDVLRDRGRLQFEELFTDLNSKLELIVTFLALLEMTKLRLTRLHQEASLEPIWVELAVSDEDLSEEEDALAGTADREEDVLGAMARTPPAAPADGEQVSEAPSASGGGEGAPVGGGALADSDSAPASESPVAGAAESESELPAEGAAESASDSPGIADGEQVPDSSGAGVGPESELPAEGAAESASDSPGIADGEQVSEAPSASGGGEGAPAGGGALADSDSAPESESPVAGAAESESELPAEGAAESASDSPGIADGEQVPDSSGAGAGPESELPAEGAAESASDSPGIADGEQVSEAPSASGGGEGAPVGGGALADSDSAPASESPGAGAAESASESPGAGVGPESELPAEGAAESASESPGAGVGPESELPAEGAAAPASDSPGIADGEQVSEAPSASGGGEGAPVGGGALADSDSAPASESPVAADFVGAGGEAEAVELESVEASLGEAFAEDSIEDRQPSREEDGCLDGEEPLAQSASERTEEGESAAAASENAVATGLGHPSRQVEGLEDAAPGTEGNVEEPTS